MDQRYHEIDEETNKLMSIEVNISYYSDLLYRYQILSIPKTPVAYIVKFCMFILFAIHDN